MDESVISTMDNTAFFDNVTWLNQQNWQNYFGKTLPNGVIVDGSLKLSETGYTLSDTMDITTDENNIIVGSGAVMANGLYAENLLPVQIPHVTQAEATKFICVRFSLESANAKIICKTNVVPSGTSYTNVIRALNVDESYLCDRNPDVYEIPLAFESYNGATLDLRRLVYAPSSEKHYLDLTSGKGNNSTAVPGVVRGKSHAQVFGGTTYFITIDSNDANSRFTLYPMFTNSTEPIIVCISNNSGSTKNLTLSNTANGFTLSYEWIDSWQSSSYGKYTDFVSGSSKILILFPAKITTSGASFGVLTKGTSEGGSVDPDSIYTKQEINNLLAQKANSADVNSALSTKEDITNLGALAYQNRVNYLTQIDNKPDQNNIIDVTYYVSRVNGSDGNLGTQESPFKTIQHAIDSVGIDCIGTIIIASDTYTEKLEIKGKHVVLKQAELPEESTYELNAEILIAPYYQQDYDRDYCIKVIDNGIAEFIGFFTIKAYLYGILVSDNSCLFLDGKYILSTARPSESDKYCSIKVDLSVSPTGNGTPLDEIISRWTGVGVHVRNASNFVTKSYNKVVISNNVSSGGAPVSAGYGFKIENSYCLAYETEFNRLYRYVFCFFGVFCYRTSSNELQGDGIISSLDFGSLAYEDTVDYGTQITNKPTLGELSDHDTVDYETEVTNKPTFGALSFKDTVDYETEVTNKPTFGALSFKDTVDYETEVTNKPSYNEIDNYLFHSYTFYVNYVNGNDDNDGSSSNPYKYIQTAVDNIPHIGTVYVTTGTAIYKSPINIDNKRIKFIFQNNFTFDSDYNTSAFLSVNNGSVVTLDGEFYLDLTFYTKGIVVSNGSILFIETPINTSEIGTGDTPHIDVNYCSKISCSKTITAHSSHNKNVVVLKNGSVGYIQNIQGSGAINCVGAANGSILMIGDTNMPTAISQTNGGLVNIS